MTQERAKSWIGRSLAASAVLPVLWTGWNLRDSPLSVALTAAAAVIGALAVQWSLHARPARVLALSAVVFLASRLALNGAAHPFGPAYGSLLAALMLAMGTVRALMAIEPGVARAFVAAGKWIAPVILLQTAGLICSSNFAWLFLLPTAHLSVGGERNAGYVHYLGAHGSMDAAVTIRTAGHTETYWLVLPRATGLTYGVALTGRRRFSLSWSKGLLVRLAPSSTSWAGHSPIETS